MSKRAKYLGMPKHDRNYLEALRRSILHVKNEKNLTYADIAKCAGVGTDTISIIGYRFKNFSYIVINKILTGLKIDQNTFNKIVDLKLKEIEYFEGKK